MQGEPTSESQGVVVNTLASEKQIKSIISNERCNVVLTHVNADFDTLAGAVALAKLWSIERPSLTTHVVMPRGVNPLVARFLAYHKHLLPVRGFKTIRKEDVAAVGIVDTQSRERLGPAKTWLDSAEHVVVADHHTHASSDIEADEVILEAVGSATTVLVERLKALADAGEPGAALTETEATLYALGIRTDTGALSFPATTTRDAYALAWLMSQGCSQSAIAEFGQTRLTAEQRSLLSEAMDGMTHTMHEGLKIGSVVLDTGRGFVTGMAAVCEEVLQLLGCDVVLMGIVSANNKGQAALSVIGRCSNQATRRMVDLNEVLQLWGGGGHPAAAAASIKLDTLDGSAEPAGEAAEELVAAPCDLADTVMEEAVAAVLKQIPEQVRAEALMTKTIYSCKPTDAMTHVLAFMNRMKRRVLPVLAEDGTITGFVKYRDPVKAVQDGKGEQQVKAWMRREFNTCSASTPFTQLEELLIEQRVAGRLYVVDDERRLLGIVSSSDLLRHHNHYRAMNRRVA